MKLADLQGYEPQAIFPKSGAAIYLSNVDEQTCVLAAVDKIVSKATVFAIDHKKLEVLKAFEFIGTNPVEVKRIDR